MLAGCAALLGACGCQTQSVKSMASTITYTSTVADDRAATFLTIGPDGEARLLIGSNRDRPGAPIGRFEAVVPGPLLKRVRAAVFSSEFASAGSQERLQPGQAYREINVVEANGKKTSKAVGDRMEPPAAFVNAEGAIEAIIEQLRASPVVAATLFVTGLPAQVGGGAPGVFDLILRNTGRAPFRIEGPAEWGKARTYCELSALRADVPLAELGPDHQRFVTLDGSAFLGASKQPEGSLLALQPGEGVALRFRHDFKWPPGRYKVEITLSLALLGHDGQPLFTGSLVSGPYPVEVSR